MQRCLALWLPEWPVQRHCHERPELAERPLVLYDRDARDGQRVRACSAAAWEHGVRPAMPLAEAQTLCGPAAADFLPHDARRDREVLTELAWWCERFSPVVGLDHADEPDTLLLDAGGVSHLFGGEAELERAVAAAFRQRGFVVRTALADTAGAAWGLARWSDAAEPEGLPVEALRLPDRTLEQLRRLGLAKLSQLRCLPRAGLAARFGKLLLERLDQVFGAAAEVLDVPARREPLAVSWALEHATVRHEVLERVLAELLARLARGLSERGEGVLRLECQLVCQSHAPLTIDVNLYQPTADPRHLLALAEMQLTLLTLPAAVEEVRVAAVATAARTQPARELFAHAPRDQPGQLAGLVERLSNRLGRDRVVRAELQAEPQVELAYRYRPLTGERPAAEKQEPDSIAGPLLRPLRLFDPPQPVEVISLARDGPPTLFHYGRRAYRVARSFGPERIETGWWRGESSRRDYYRVETERGQRLWLFRRLQDQRWFLQGEF